MDTAVQNQQYAVAPKAKPRVSQNQTAELTSKRVKFKLPLILLKWAHTLL